MSKLLISKSTEAKVIATIWNMGVESLNPDDYTDLERIISRICCTRSIVRKEIGIEHALLSGRKHHDSDCATNNAPAMIPSPCDCDNKIKG